MASDIHTLSDSLLWKRFLEGDSSAYSQIYNQTVQELFRYGLLYTSDRELVKDDATVSVPDRKWQARPPESEVLLPDKVHREAPRWGIP